MTFAYIQHGEWGGPYLTVKADGVAIEKEARPNPYASGYGPKIPTRYKVLCQGRWRRVYAACYGNSSSVYVVINGVDTIVDIVETAQ